MRYRQITTIRASLVPLIGELAVLVKPYGSIFIDGDVRVKDSDQKFKTKLEVGNHTLTAMHPKHGIWEKEIVIHPDSLREIAIDFTKKVRIRIASAPASGEIYVDNNPTGYWTPHEVDVQIGKRIIEVRRDGYVLVGGGKTFSVENELEMPLMFELDKTDNGASADDKNKK